MEVILLHTSFKKRVVGDALLMVAKIMIASLTLEQRTLNKTGDLVCILLYTWL